MMRVVRFDRVLREMRARQSSVAKAVFFLGGFGMFALIRDTASGLSPFLGTLYMLCPTVAIVHAAGIVSEDVRRGGIELWFQKPVRPVPLYLERFAEAWLASGFWILLIVVVSQFLILNRFVPQRADVLILLPVFLLIALIAGSIAFGMSPWVTRGTGVCAGAFLIGGYILENSLSIRTDLLRAWVRAVFLPLLPPESALSAIGAFSEGTGDVIWMPLGRIVLYSAGWIGIGCLGVARLARNGGLSGSHARSD